MGATEDQLKQEADLQRSRMGDTLDAIGDRLSPERMVERRKAAVGQKLRSVRETLMGSPDYSEPATLRRRAEAGGAMSSAADALQAAGTQAQQAPKMIADQARGNPVAAGIIAFGTGLLFATLLPQSRTEQRVVEDAKPQLRQVADELKDAGREIASEAKDHAQEAAGEVKSTGADATSKVRNQAGRSAREVKDEVQG